MSVATVDDLRIEDVTERAAQWLLEQQEEFTGGWGQQRGQDPNALNTAEAMLALLSCDCGITAGHESIKRGREFLLANQSEAGAWTRQVKHGGQVREIADVVRTSLAVQALIAAGLGADDEPIGRAVRWLGETDDAGERGWGYDTEHPSHFLPTCFALVALTVVAATHVKREDRQEFHARYIAAPLDDILAAQNGDGSFDAAGPLQAAHTLYAVMLVQKLRSCGFAVPPDTESRALQWLRLNPNAAMALVEEEIVLDPAQPQHNYSFLFMTDALLVSVFYAAESTDERSSELARRALYDVRLRWVPGAGFLGNRMFSWSTAKCLLALREAARTRVERFPVLHPEPQPDQTRAPQTPPRTTFRVALGLTLALLVASVALAMTDNFGPVIGSFLGLLTISTLLITGRISEQTFATLAQRGAAVGSAPSMDSQGR